MSILDTKTRKLVDKWKIPHGGSPDMGGVSADGKVLWLSGRWSSEVYAFDTIPNTMNPHEVFWIVVIAILSSVLGALVPAIRAAGTP